MPSSTIEAPLVLALETSCDETAVAVVRGREELLASRISSQIVLHQPYGGIVPEVASRNHLRLFEPLIVEALGTADVDLEEIDAFAATRGPGLATSLMVGLSAAKGLAIASGKPFLAVNHLEGHLFSPFFGRAEGPMPCVALVVSGGHTVLLDFDEVGRYAVLGQTLDDAAGEAFDKVAKILGLPYPGGPEIDREARAGDPQRYVLPRGMLRSGDYSFSFSGLKTAVLYLLPKLSGDYIADVCASFQEAVVDVLVEKTLRAVRETGKHRIGLSGGVSCNTGLRARFEEACRSAGVELYVAEPELCTDNAAMIAAVAVEKLVRGESSSLSEDIDPNLKL